MSIASQEKQTLNDFLTAGPYVGYCYSYPHKTAYRSLPSESLASVWGQEEMDSLFLYVHVPFCEFRCGFCNLFTFSQPNSEVPRAYLATLRREAEAVRDALPEAGLEQVAIGGGTPSYLDERELTELFSVLEFVLKNNKFERPVAMEVSPATLTAKKLQLMKQFGVDRVSMGIQSWNEKDVGKLGRPQRNHQVLEAIDTIRMQDIERLNLDLIYGGAGQTVHSWIASIEATLRHTPEEIYLYPLYVRPLTGLERRSSPAEDIRLECYREGRDLLLSSGYEQVSMRMFRRASASRSAAQEIDYRCQDDGMIGLGCGARSYTSKLHYGSRYAVRQAGVGQIIDEYIAQDSETLATVRHGIQLDSEELRRRFLILSLFLVEGFALSDYKKRFGTELFDDIPCLQELISEGLAELDFGNLRLTPAGIEQSDAIGPWLYSDSVRQRMEAYSWETN